MKHKKTILVFIDWYRPGYRAGGPITSCSNFIEALKGEFAFKVITRDRDYMSDQPYDLKSDQWITKGDDHEVFYLSPQNISKKGIRSLVSDLHFDFIYINGIFSWNFSILPLILFPKKRIIVAPRGMLKPSALRVKSFKKRLYLKLAKMFNLYRRVLFHSTNQEESNDIKRIFKNAEIRIAHNLPKSFENAIMQEKTKEKGKLRICFPGRIAKEKNLKYALEVVSEVKGKVEMSIAGELYDSSYWAECKTLLNSMPENVSAKVLGALKPDDFRSELERNDISLLPTLGENFGHAIIESLSLGSPVLISDQTPWKNLKTNRAGMDISLNAKDKFISALQEFCDMDTSEFHEWRKNAREYANNNVDWHKFKGEYRELFK